MRVAFSFAQRALESFSLEITRLPPLPSRIYILYTLYFASSIAPKDRRRSSKDFPADFSSSFRENATHSVDDGIARPRRRRRIEHGKTGGPNKCEREGGGKRRTVLLNRRPHQRASIALICKGISGIVVFSVALASRIYPPVFPSASSSFPVTRPFCCDRAFLPPHFPGMFLLIPDTT